MDDAWAGVSYRIMVSWRIRNEENNSFPGESYAIELKMLLSAIEPPTSTEQ